MKLCLIDNRFAYLLTFGAIRQYHLVEQGRFGGREGNE